MVNEGYRYYLRRTDGTQGQIDGASYDKIKALIMKAAEDSSESNKRELAEFVFSTPYIGTFDPKTRFIER